MDSHKIESKIVWTIAFVFINLILIFFGALFGFFVGYLINIIGLFFGFWVSKISEEIITIIALVVGGYMIYYGNMKLMRL